MHFPTFFKLHQKKLFSSFSFSKFPSMISIETNQFFTISTTGAKLSWISSHLHNDFQHVKNSLLGRSPKISQPHPWWPQLERPRFHVEGKNFVALISRSSYRKRVWKLKLIIRQSSFQQQYFPKYFFYFG